MSKSISEFHVNLTSASKKLKDHPALASLSPIAYRYRLNPEGSASIIKQRQEDAVVGARTMEGVQNLLLISVDKSFQEFYGLLYSWKATQGETTWNCLPIVSKSWKLSDVIFSYAVYLQPGKIMINHRYRAPMEKNWHESELSFEIFDVQNDISTLDSLIRIIYLEGCRKFIIKCADTKFAEDAITKAMNKILKKI